MLILTFVDWPYYLCTSTKCVTNEQSRPLFFLKFYQILNSSEKILFRLQKFIHWKLSCAILELVFLHYLCLTHVERSCKIFFFSATAPFFVRKEHRLLVTLWLVSIFIVEMRFFCQNVGFNNFRYRRIDDIAS